MRDLSVGAMLLEGYKIGLRKERVIKGGLVEKWITKVLPKKLS